MRLRICRPFAAWPAYVVHENASPYGESADQSVDQPLSSWRSFRAKDTAIDVGWGSRGNIITVGPAHLI
jgi:hypothetical protein